MEEKIEKIKKSLKKKLDSDRYQHTLGVAYTAICLAMRYEVDLEQAELAGLLHDCAKNISDKEKLQKCAKNHIEITTYEQDNPSLLHAKLGGFLAEHKYEVTDRDVLSAIRWHTTGKPAMSMLEKIIFVADYIEPRRNKAPNLAYIRKIAFEDLDFTVYEIMKSTILYVKERNFTMDPITEDAYHYYEKLIERK